MSLNIKNLRTFLLQLELPTEQRNQLLSYVNVVERDLDNHEFMLKRIEKDKEIMANLLNASILDLQKNQLITKERNVLLEEQKKEIEVKNVQLKQQKEHIEEQSTKLKEHLSKLEMSYQEMEQFTYIASHDLKSPLRTIANFAQLLSKRHRPELNEEAQEFIDFIVSGTKRMNQVICDLLEYSKVGNREKAMTWVNLENVLEEVKKALRINIEQNQVIIEAAPLPTLWVNKLGITQIFQNLIANAIKFRRQSVPHIQIDCKQEEATWRISFEDNGVGIEETYQEKAFLPFHRLGNIEIPGTGMGLAICKKIVKLHQGDIWYESEFGKGTTFYFTLSQLHMHKNYIALEKNRF